MSTEAVEAVKQAAFWFYVDVTAAVPNELLADAYKNNWSNELHPKDVAFIRVAEAFQQKILNK